ncbi:MurR/RpiR family transcriptional regulator [Camelliibacillus cellulosilyticus]|uniref:MurR/RpiR family transcriptional regulator n=1 Tax=Camelliibacillus cellulosilyticus TaxID=2174486 RepID=A0ABV9GUJ0_9BACL
MMNGGLVSIKTALNQLKPSEFKAAKYILDHPEEVVQLSIQRLARLSGVSEATIIRLTKSLNMKGFQELKLRIAGDLHDKTESYQEIKMDDSAEAIVKAVSYNNKQSIEDTVSVLSISQVNRAVAALSAAKKIDFYGTGASSLIAMDAVQKFTRINCWCESFFDFHSMLTSAVNLGEKDVAFGISYSGQTEEIIQSLLLAKEQGATIISLTKFGNSPVSDLADIRLFTSSTEQSIRSGAMASRIAQLNVIDILFIMFASQNHQKVIPLLEKTRIAVSRTKRP